MNNEAREGELDSADQLALDLTEDEIRVAIGNRVEHAESFWDEKLNLTAVRDMNEQRWLNSYIAKDESRLYDYQMPYKDNRMFTDIETLIPMVLSRPPMPLVIEAHDNQASRELATNLQKNLLADYEDLYLKSRFHLVARHLLIGYRLGVMKYGWDDNAGPVGADGERMGEITVETLRPQRVAIDAGATDKLDIPLIAEFLSAPVEELTAKYPSKADEIMRAAGFQPGVAANMYKPQGYVECWFSYYKGGKKREGVAVKLKDVVLDSFKNPYWNYKERDVNDKGELVNTNFHDRPMKPYVMFNYLNLGRYVIDDTSLAEQAAPIQEVLNKRGRQIVENADSANSGTVFNSDMISPEDAAKIIGDPQEKVMVKGNVQNAATRLPINLLPEYVYADKIDARNEIDNIFGVHSALRGDQSNSPTLGQEVLSQRGDMSRSETLATALEDGADQLYKGMVQLKKVFYTEPRTVRQVDTTGKVNFLTVSGNSIEPGIQVRVKSGSVLPEDRVSKYQQTEKMAPLLDPLSLGEGLSKEDPKEFAKRLLYFRIMPDKYMTEILGVNPEAGMADPNADQHNRLLSQGQDVPPEQSPTKEHLATHQAFIESPQFAQLPPQIQQLIMAHVKQEIENTKGALGQSPPPPQAAPPEQPGQMGGAMPAGMAEGMPMEKRVTNMMSA